MVRKYGFIMAGIIALIIQLLLGQMVINPGFTMASTIVLMAQPSVVEDLVHTIKMENLTASTVLLSYIPTERSNTG
jgi:hypothetical protein